MIERHYRKIRVPVMQDDIIYRAKNARTGEILECMNLDPLLRYIADDLARANFDAWSLSQERT